MSGRSAVGLSAAWRNGAASTPPGGGSVSSMSEYATDRSAGSSTCGGGCDTDSAPKNGCSSCRSIANSAGSVGAAPAAAAPARLPRGRVPSPRGTQQSAWSGCCRARRQRCPRREWPATTALRCPTPGNRRRASARARSRPPAAPPAADGGRGRGPQACPPPDARRWARTRRAPPRAAVRPVPAVPGEARTSEAPRLPTPEAAPGRPPPGRRRPARRPPGQPRFQAQEPARGGLRRRRRERRHRLDFASDVGE